MWLPTLPVYLQIAASRLCSVRSKSAPVYVVLKYFGFTFDFHNWGVDDLHTHWATLTNLIPCRAGMYLTKNLQTPGGGDILMALLGPLTISYAFTLFRQRSVSMQKHSKIAWEVGLQILSFPVETLLHCIRLRCRRCTLQLNSMLYLSHLECWYSSLRE